MDEAVRGDRVDAEDNKKTRERHSNEIVGVHLPNKITCILCRVNFDFDGLPATEYEKHLYEEHSVLFEMDMVIQETLQLQVPSLADPPECQCSLQVEDKTRIKFGLIENVEIDNLRMIEKDFKTTDGLLSNTELHPESFESWKKGKCVFQCKICPLTWSESADFLQHVVKKHKLDEESYLKKFLNLGCVVNNMMTCKICNQEIEHDSRIMNNHMKDKHKIVLEEYFDRFVNVSKTDIFRPSSSIVRMDSVIVTTTAVANKESENCNSEEEWPPTEIEFIEEPFEEDTEVNTSKYFSSVSNKQDRLQTSTKNESKNKQASLSTPASLTTPRNLRTLAPKTQLGITLPIKSTDKHPQQWLNKCTYVCNICSFLTNFCDTFIDHLKKVHRLSASNYMKTNGVKLMTTVVKHICQLCGLLIDWESQTISIHLSFLHPSISAEDYVQTYETNYSENPPIEKNESENPPQRENENKWLNLCIFECKECCPRVTFSTHNKLIDHLNHKHKISAKDYQQKHGNFYLLIDNHTCKVCNRSFRWDIDTITSHLHIAHSMSPDVYVKKYFLGVVKPALTKNTEIKIASPSQPDPRTKASSSTVKSHSLNRCTYKCNICSFETHNYNSFYPHISKEHKMSAEFYMEKYKTELQHKIVYHTCQLCGFISNWDKAWISCHLASAHEMLISDYVEKTEDSYKQFPIFLVKENEQWMNQCTFTCSHCPTPVHFQTRSNLNVHLFKEHQLINKDYFKKHASYATSVRKMTCKICDKLMRWDKETITEHLDKEHKMNPDAYVNEVFQGDINAVLGLKSQTPGASNTVAMLTDQWLNRCEYTCKMCPLFRVDSYKGLLAHIVDVHKLYGKSYVDKHRDNMLSKRVPHTCQLCGAVIDWDRNSIVSHLLVKHRHVSSQEYVQKFQNSYSDFFEIEQRTISVVKAISALKADAEPSKLKCDESLSVQLKKTEDGNSVPNEEHTWARGCLYSCHVCQKYFAGLKPLHAHVRSLHHSNLKSIDVVKASVHCCHMCQRQVVHDEIELKAHFQTMHNISISEYYHRYKDTLQVPTFNLLQPSEQIKSGPVVSLVSPKQVKEEISEPVSKRLRSSYQAANCDQIEVKEEPLDID